MCKCILRIPTSQLSITQEEIYDIKIICEQDDATNIFEDLKCGDVFRLSHFKHDSNTYMRVNNAFDNIINVIAKSRNYDLDYSS